MAGLSVREASLRLGVGVQRVHQRIADGSLRAERIGSQWVVDEASLAAVRESDRAGRPLSERSAWAMVTLSEGDQVAVGALAPSERARARERLGRLLAGAGPGAGRSEADVQASCALLRLWFRRRATRLLFRASQLDLPDLYQDSRLLRSGLSHPAAGIAAGQFVEAYLVADDVDAVITGYLLSSVQGDRDANVVLHARTAGTTTMDGDIAPLLLAADLAEHRGPREEAVAVRLIREIAVEHPELVPSQQRGRPQRGRGVQGREGHVRRQNL
jgi:excisionase family DNA binding protein